MNFIRLLYCTECLAAQKQLGTTYKDYVKTLETFFNTLTSSNHRPSPENIRKYEIRVSSLAFISIFQISSVNFFQCVILSLPHSSINNHFL
ncbi:unnamed protein product [Schistosoma mattheei]|uniref:Uncharacterized protein n=1 Tax=Schistosoma mattheei TaxID=31246 RepID=A0A183P7Q7_9TREM|nr:unnamed protein product [Schistosoma mattheei]